MSVSPLPPGVVRGVTPIRAEDADLIRTFPRFEGAGTPGFVTDFIGMRTRTEFFDHMNDYDGAVLDYPIPGDAHYSGLEWAGTLRAVRDAGEELAVLELGAGWGPWLVASTLAYRATGRKRVRLLGVEGSRHHYQYMRAHFVDNGIDPDSQTLLHGIVASTDGFAAFPVLSNPRAEWGAVAVADSGSESGSYERLRAYSLETLLTPFELVDLIHIDIQGHEADVIRASREVLAAKAKRLVIGTHSRAIEQELFDELGAAGWILEAEEPTIVRQLNGAPELFIDGCQVWVNPGVHARR